MIIDDYPSAHRKGKRGRKPTPHYARSDRDIVFLLAFERAAYLIEEKGKSKSDAESAAETEYDLEDGSLRRFRQGKRGSSSRMKRRRTAALKSRK